VIPGGFQVVVVAELHLAGGRHLEKDLVLNPAGGNSRRNNEQQGGNDKPAQFHGNLQQMLGISAHYTGIGVTANP